MKSHSIPLQPSWKQQSKSVGCTADANTATDVLPNTDYVQVIEKQQKPTRAIVEPAVYLLQWPLGPGSIKTFV